MFIVLEGLDGAGKSTQVKLLENYFSDKDIMFKYLHFPRFDTPIFGKMIAKFLRGDFGNVNEVNPYIVALIYAEDRNNAAKTIKKWLKNGYIVIVDRYVYSNIGYQCAKINDKVERKELQKWILDLEYGHFKIPKPDLNIFLDVPFVFTKNNLESARGGNDRNYLDGKKDIHESNLELQQNVRNVYLEQAKYDEKFKIVNCNAKNGEMLDKQEIFKLILKNIQK